MRNNNPQKDIKERLKDVIDREIENLPALLEKLPPQDRVEAILEILPYALPKLKPEKD